MCVVGTTRLQLLQHVLCRDIQHAEARTVGTVPESLGDVTLADTGLPKQQGVLAPFDESARGEVEYLRLRRLRVEMTARARR